MLFYCCSDLHYLEAVVLESMRLQPPAYMVGRCVTQHLDVKGYTLTPGAIHPTDSLKLSASAFKRISTEFVLCLVSKV